MACDCGNAGDDELANFAVDQPRTLFSPAVNKVTVLSELKLTKTILPPNEISEAFITLENNNKIKFVPRADAFFDTKEEALVILLDVAGFKKESMTVEVGNGLLTISGNRAETELTDNYGEPLTIHIQERASGYFYRQFRLPSNTQENTACAGLLNGVLEIHMKCIQTQEPKEIPIVEGRAGVPDTKKDSKGKM